MQKEDPNQLIKRELSVGGIICDELHSRCRGISSGVEDKVPYLSFDFG